MYRLRFPLPPLPLLGGMRALDRVADSARLLVLAVGMLHYCH